MQRVREIMLSLAEYAVVDAGATLKETLDELAAAQPQRPAGRQPHRAVLVRNLDGEIIGKLGHLAFLRALLPERRILAQDELLERAGVSDNMRAASEATFEMLAADLVDICERAHSLYVGDACIPATTSIAEDASLVDAIRAFIHSQTLSILVRRGPTTVGILRLADLFDELARQVCSTCDSE